MLTNRQSRSRRCSHNSWARLSLSATFFFALSTSGTAAGQPFRITDLGTLGGAESEPHHINNLGQVVGESDTAGGSRRAFLWLPDAAFGLPSGINDLGTLGGSASAAFGINNLGQTVGRADTATPGIFHAFLWDPPTGTMLDLGALSGELGEASTINDFGEIVGRTQFVDHSFFVAFWRDPAGLVVLLTEFVPGDYESEAVGIGYAGNLNFAGTTYFPAHAFKFGGETGFIQLEDLGVESSANGMNSINQVVGSVSSENWEHAASWQFAGLSDLGTLGGTNSRANDINDAGQIVGAADTIDELQHAFLWRQGQMNDLNDAVAFGPGWELTEARAINALGQIVGCGRFRNQERAFLLTPCEADGDMDGNTVTNGQDIQPFVEALLDLSTDPSPVCAGDFSENGVEDPSDIPALVVVLLAP